MDTKRRKSMKNHTTSHQYMMSKTTPISLKDEGEEKAPTDTSSKSRVCDYLV